MNNLNFDHKVVGSRIRSHREFLGFTREEIAEKLGISPNFYRDIELGSKGFSVPTLISLSRELKVTTDYILFGTINKANITPIQLLIESLNDDQQKHAEELLKIFVLATTNK
ncbi:helix-turn-helix domain-containing protein [Erysipelotrichaceae bacterium OttesenSCG-928-M19]|nr:helix-turn-helix domain-containing protein [Erysipelotrichaceae bacterium OttesenSCG-928-M19]